MLASQQEKLQQIHYLQLIFSNQVLCVLMSIHRVLQLWSNIFSCIQARQLLYKSNKFLHYNGYQITIHNLLSPSHTIYIYIHTYTYKQVKKMEHEHQNRADKIESQQIEETNIDTAQNLDMHELALREAQKAKGQSNLCLKSILFVAVFVCGVILGGMDWGWAVGGKGVREESVIREVKRDQRAMPAIDIIENSNLNQKNIQIKEAEQPLLPVQFQNKISEILPQNTKKSETAVQSPQIPSPSPSPPPPPSPTPKPQISLPQPSSPQKHSPRIQHPHEKLTFNYATMGMKEPGTTFNFTQVKSAELKQFQKQMEKVFKPYNDTNCQLERYGDHDDGGYLICKNLVKDTEGLINFGIEGRDLFGCQVSSVFKISNYQLDCTNSFAPPCQTNNNKNIFEMGCIGEKSEQSFQKFYSLKDIVDMKDLKHKHVMMKIDVEGAEWPGLRTFPIQYLDYVDQFIFEIHFNGAGLDHLNYWGNLDIIKAMGEKFVSVNFHVNNNGCWNKYINLGHFGSLAIQVTLVNKNIIKVNSNSRSYRLHPRNYINNPSIGFDCQMSD